MAESLKVVMMNQSTLLSVPVEYNSCILHVLEAYQEAREELLKKNEEMEELKKDHEKDIKEFEELATQWEFKERDYKAEMKKLEVQLSKTENGMEKVTLARTKSTVYGSKKIVEAVGRRVSTIKERNAARNSKGKWCHRHFWFITPNILKVRMQWTKYQSSLMCTKMTKVGPRYATREEY